MSVSPMKVINIVGGGSAGWMTAIYLNRYFNQARKNFSINVIESPDIGAIGVGEATVHSIRFFFAAMGLDEKELMAETNATVKTGIMFRNWKKPSGARVHEYFHPFDQQQPGGSIDISSAWLLSDRAGSERYDEAVSINSHLITDGLCPKAPRSPDFGGVTPYGYHLDATLMGRFLRRKAVEAGVNHIEATVSDVVVGDGQIRSVVTDSGSISGDLFVDCTGFRGLLIDRLKADNWESFADALPCDKAVAIQRALPGDGRPRPYTVATALDHGWAWQIDLTSRQGCGYVYDSKRLTPSQAEAELRDFLGRDSEFLSCNHLDMRVGRRQDFWVGNCVAVGLAGGFIEPLESTGLHMIHLGVGLLATHLAGGVDVPPLREAYNAKMRGFYEDLKQFIVLHYALTDRDDTAFWRAAASTLSRCPWLEQQLRVWEHKICEHQDFAGSFASIFTDMNYRYVLYGMNRYPRLTMSLDERDSMGIFSRFSAQVGQVLPACQTHEHFLETVRQDMAGGDGVQ